MNMGYEDDELKPYLEPEPDYRDHKRIGESTSMYITLTTYCLMFDVTPVINILWHLIPKLCNKNLFFLFFFSDAHI